MCNGRGRYGVWGWGEVGGGGEGVYVRVHVPLCTKELDTQKVEGILGSWFVVGGSICNVFV